jgi:hypothetical protein
MVDLGELPPRIKDLPLDPRGWPIPWFVAYVDGLPDFRVMDREKFFRAIRDRLCWVCGQKLGRWLAFSLGPMCSVSRTISEPPAHRDCAEWSVQHCPFLANPEMVRRHEDLPTNVDEPAGIAIMRNPGVMALWITRSFEAFRVPGDRMPLLTVGEPDHITWWCHGRQATRAEVQAAVESGLPNLLAVAKKEGAFAVEALGKQVKRAEALWPPA